MSLWLKNKSPFYPEFVYVVIVSPDTITIWRVHCGYPLRRVVSSLIARVSLFAWTKKILQCLIASTVPKPVAVISKDLLIVADCSPRKKTVFYLASVAEKHLRIDRAFNYNHEPWQILMIRYVWLSYRIPIAKLTNPYGPFELLHRYRASR